MSIVQFFSPQYKAIVCYFAFLLLLLVFLCCVVIVIVVKLIGKPFFVSLFYSKLAKPTNYPPLAALTSIFFLFYFICTVFCCCFVWLVFSLCLYTHSLNLINGMHWLDTDYFFHLLYSHYYYYYFDDWNIFAFQWQQLNATTNINNLNVPSL